MIRLYHKMWPGFSNPGRAPRKTQKSQDNELRIAQDDREEDALQNYFDKMTELILWERLTTTDPVEHKSIRDLARARTLSILRSFKGSEAAVHKASVLQFLYESELIQGIKPIIKLDGADLSGANLRGANLMRANLMWTNLRGANLSGADLSGANLMRANLRGANVIKAILNGTRLNGCNLSEADLSGANLSWARLSWADLSGTDLSEAKNLDRAILTNIYYGDRTQWPSNFTPPPSRTRRFIDLTSWR